MTGSFLQVCEFQYFAPRFMLPKRFASWSMGGTAGLLLPEHPYVGAPSWLIGTFFLSCAA